LWWLVEVEVEHRITVEPLEVEALVVIGQAQHYRLLLVRHIP
jgi:hypothetical protein